MSEPADILLLGSGPFAARIAFDLAATARQPTRVIVAARNPARLDWVRTAARARAALFETPARFETTTVDLLDDGEAAALLARVRPRVVVQAASAQPGSVIAGRPTSWTRLVAEGGLSATAVFQALVTCTVAAAVRDAHPTPHLVNCCFPDVVNGLVAASGLPVLCGAGNIGILSNAFAGDVQAAGQTGELRMLAHYQQLGVWRAGPAERGGPPPRLWLDERELPDVFTRFAAVRLTPEPAIDISGASAVPLALALAHGRTWRGHVPGPHGLPGGYPVGWDGETLHLDLPPGLTKQSAVAWNAQFEAENGLVIEGARARYTGRLHEALRRVSPSLAAGFALDDLRDVHAEMQTLRAQLDQG
ncbi:MAG TPA: hypothetical protein VJY39_19460 [Acidisphaera sp.]|nr:hypothetical protein [Acidisphaera sp.]